jgi:DNA-binding Xre family transcriptional regulator
MATLHHTAIIEVKWQLTRAALYQAIGQVLLYRSCLNPDARAIIVGYETRETVTLVPHIAALGVEVVCWRDPVEEVQDTELSEVLTRPVAEPSALHLAALRWNVQTLAITRGLSSVRELSFVTRKPRQSLYGVWMGQAKTVSLEMLTALAKGLDVDAGAWFGWESSGEGRQLVWDIERQRRMRGMSVEELSFTARILPASLDSILDGTAQFVFLTTLVKLAKALDLNIGELFAWIPKD